jgi:thiol-disulfide isomerase/thioredoxin
MANVVDVVRKFIRPYNIYILIVILVIIFGYIGHMIYKKYNVESFDVANDSLLSDGSQAVIYFFHADWCPHCKKAEPEWESFKKANDGKEINGHTINCVNIDCTNEDDAETTEYINKFNIDSYPTIKLIKDGKTIEFDSRITATSLEGFLNTMLDA